MVSRQTAAVAGFTIMELVCAFAVLSILISAGFLGAASKLGNVRRAYQETVALQAASGWLEQLQADRGPLRIGTTEFALSPAAQKTLAGAQGTSEVRRLEPGLYEVSAQVQWHPLASTPAVKVTLRTLVVREREQG
jgi:type II secretory pathway pseudopilin PulG